MKKEFIKAAIGCAIISLTLCACNGGNVGNENGGMIDENGLLGTNSSGYTNKTGTGITNNTLGTNNILGTQSNTNNSNNISGATNSNNSPSISNSSGILNMNNIWKDIMTESGDNLPAKNVDDEYLEDTYGIKKEDVEDYRLFVSDDDKKSDEIFVAKVKQGKMDDITDAIKNRQQVLETKWRDENKDEIDKISDYKMSKNGDYVLFVISEKADRIKEIFDGYTDK